MQVLEKKLEMVEEFMEELIQNYGEAYLPIFNDFWSFYNYDNEDDSSSDQN